MNENSFQQKKNVQRLQRILDSVINTEPKFTKTQITNNKMLNKVLKLKNLIKLRISKDSPSNDLQQAADKLWNMFKPKKTFSY